MTLPQISVLLEKYLRDEASDPEKLLVETWLKSRENIHNDWEQLNEDERKKWLEILFMDVQRSIAGHHDEKVLDSPNLFPDKEQKSSKLLWYAAACIAAFTLIIGIYFTSSRKKVSEVISLTRIETARGIRKKVILQDGSTVWLGPKSELSFSSKFLKDAARSVYLTGEGYFEVTQDNSHPFIVLAGGLETRVLGTSFNISSYKDDEEIRVVLQSGALQILRQGATPSSAIKLFPNEMLIFNKANNNIKKQIAPEQLTINSFKKGSLLFERAKFGTVVKRISDAYGLRIQLSNPNLNNCLITGVFDLTQSIDELMKIVSISVSATYSRDGKDIYIKGNGCQ
ncbi:FecR family protein [bacterium A37T11]|nr:FecR family protein [bacterium A37T11]